MAPFLTTTVPTGQSLTPEQRAELITVPLRRDALALNVATVLDISRDEVRIPVLTADVDNVAVVPEGTEIPQGHPTVVEKILRPVKYGITAEPSREAVDDSQPGVLDVFGASLAASLRKSIDSDFIHAVDAGPSSVGVLEDANIVVGADLGTANLDSISDAIATIEAADGRADVIVMSAATWGRISKLKTEAQANVPLLGSPASPSTTQSLDAGSGRSLFGVPVFVNPAVSDDIIGVWDRAAVVTAMRDNSRLDIDYSAAFRSDNVVVRAVTRLDWQVIDPRRVVTISTVTP